MSMGSVVLSIALLGAAVPAWGAGEARPAEKNYHLVFHTELSGESEDVSLLVSEGAFHVSSESPNIGIQGHLDVTEDFMYRLEYQFSHGLGNEGDGDSVGNRYYERSGRVVLAPGETVQVVDAPEVRLSIELKATE